MPDICVKEYVERLHKLGEYEIADYLRILNAERDATVSYLRMWPCDSCKWKRSKEFCDTCARNRMKIAKGYALTEDMYRYREPGEI